MVGDRTTRNGPVVPIRNQRGSSPKDRVREQTKLRALEQARRVTWQRLAAATDEYTEWQVFGLWLRAVVESAGSVPPNVAQEMKSRIPQFFDPIHPDIQAVVKTGSGPGARIWEDVSLWGAERFCRPETGRLVGCRPVLFIDVATFDAGV